MRRHFRLRRIIVTDRLFLFLGGRGSAALRGRERRIAARRQNDFPRRAVLGCAHHQKVIAGPIQQRRKNVARITRAIGSKNALILAQSIHGHTARRRKLVENLRQAGVVRIHGERTAAEGHPRGLSRFIEKGREVGGRRSRVWTRTIGRACRAGSHRGYRRRSWLRRARNAGAQSRSGKLHAPSIGHCPRGLHDLSLRRGGESHRNHPGKASC